MGVGISSNTVYYSISNGKIVRQFPNKTESSIERINKNQRTVHEEFYDFLDGVLSDIYIKESEYGRFWNVVLQDDRSGVKQILQVNYSSGYALGFLKALPNVDVKRAIKIIPNAKKDGEKTKTTIFIKQGDSSLKWYFTKDQPNGLPPLKKVRVKGKEIWDDSLAMDFLEKMVKTKILPKLIKGSAERSITSESVIGDDGLPF
jgi:hypothetical protein